MTASLAYTNSSDPTLRLRALLAEQSFEHTRYTLDALARFAQRTAAAIGQSLKRWSAARRQAAQDRMFWELALTDPRMMAEINAIQAAAEWRGKSAVDA